MIAAESVDLQPSIGAIAQARTVRELDLGDRALLGQIDEHVLAGRDPRVAERLRGGAVVEVDRHRAQVDHVVHGDELELTRVRVADADVVVAVAWVGAHLDEWIGTRGSGRREQEGGGE